MLCSAGGQGKGRDRKTSREAVTEFPGHMTQRVSFSHRHLVPPLRHHWLGYSVTETVDVTWVQIWALPLTT